MHHIYSVFIIVQLCLVTLIPIAAQESRHLLTQASKDYLDLQWSAHMAQLTNSPSDLELYLTILLLSVLQCQKPTENENLQVEKLNLFLKDTRLVPDSLEMDKLAQVYTKCKTKFDSCHCEQLNSIVTQVPPEIRPLFDHLKGKGCMADGQGYQCRYSFVIRQFMREYSKVCLDCLPQSHTEWFRYLRQAELEITVWNHFEATQKYAQEQKELSDYFEYLNHLPKTNNLQQRKCWSPCCQFLTVAGVIAFVSLVGYYFWPSQENESTTQPNNTTPSNWQSTSESSFAQLSEVWFLVTVIALVVLILVAIIWYWNMTKNKKRKGKRNAPRKKRQIIQDYKTSNKPKQTNLFGKSINLANCRIKSIVTSNKCDIERTPTQSRKNKSPTKSIKTVNVKVSPSPSTMSPLNVLDSSNEPLLRFMSSSSDTSSDKVRTIGQPTTKTKPNEQRPLT